MYILSCNNLNFCLYNSSLDFLKKYMENVELMKTQMRNDIEKMRDQFGSPLESEWNSLNEKILTEDIDDAEKISELRSYTKSKNEFDKYLMKEYQPGDIVRVS